MGDLFGGLGEILAGAFEVAEVGSELREMGGEREGGGEGPPETYVRVLCGPRTPRGTLNINDR